MSNGSYNGPSGLGYGQSFNQPVNRYNPTTNNSSSGFGYSVKPNQAPYNQIPSNQVKVGTYQQNTPTNVGYGQSGQTFGYTQPQYNQLNKNLNTFNSYNQSQQLYQQPPQLRSEPKNLFGQMIRGGGLNQIDQQMNGINQQMTNLNLNSNNQLQQGLNLWMDLAKSIDWDTLIKKKNMSKKQSDTSWINYQEQSWLQPKPSNNIQIETDRKFAFPNPYIKYKLIPGVDEKMALDVTAKDNLDKGYVKGNLIIWDYHGGPNQQFYIHRCDNSDEFILINAATGFVVSAINLTINSGKTGDKNRLCVYPKMEQNKNQRWLLKPYNKAGDIYVIQSVATGKVLDCQNQSSSNGTNVLQWSQNKGKNQLWKILPA